MEYVIEIEHLVKHFKEVKAVNDISFRVKRGDLFAFLGVNGAGKSTTISILCGQLKKDSGVVRINGFDPDENTREAHSALGVVFQSSVLDKPLTVRQNLESRAALYGITGERFLARLAELGELLDFSDLFDRTLGKLSGGQLRRVDIARALLHHPRILILDEPTTGLDPQTRQLLWRVIGHLRRQEGMTVLLTTHYMEEAADADYVVILDAGQVVAEGTPLELKNRYAEDSVLLTTHYMEEAADADYVVILDAGQVVAEGTPLELKNRYAEDSVILYGAEEAAVAALTDRYERLSEGIRIRVSSTAEATELILKQPALFCDYEIVKGRMDDVFLNVTGKHLGGEKV